MNYHVATFVARGGSIYKVLIADSSLTEDETLTLGPTPCRLSYEGDDDDVFKPVKSVTAKIQIVTSSLLTWLYTADPMGVDVYVQKNGKDIFHGYVLPSVWSMPISDEPHVVEVEACDPLTVLKYYYYTQIDAAHRQLTTFQEVFGRCADKMGVNVVYDVDFYSEAGTGIVGANNATLSEDALLPLHHYEDEDKGPTWLEIMEGIGRITGGTFMVWNNVLHVLSYGKTYTYSDMMRGNQAAMTEVIGDSDGTMELTNIRTSGYSMEVVPALRYVNVKPSRSDEMVLVDDLFDTDRLVYVMNGSTFAGGYYTDSDGTKWAINGTPYQNPDVVLGTGAAMGVVGTHPASGTWDFGEDCDRVLVARGGSIAETAQHAVPVLMNLTHEQSMNVNLPYRVLGVKVTMTYWCGALSNQTPNIKDTSAEGTSNGARVSLKSLDAKGNILFSELVWGKGQDSAGWATTETILRKVPAGRLSLSIIDGYFRSITVAPFATKEDAVEVSVDDDLSNIETSIYNTREKGSWVDGMDLSSLFTTVGTNIGRVDMTGTPYADYKTQYSVPRLRITATAEIEGFHPYKKIKYQDKTFVVDSAELDLRDNTVTVKMTETEG